MLDPRSFSMADVDTLLAMPELHAVDAKIAAELNLRIVPLNSTTKRMLLVEISQAGLPVSEIQKVISSEPRKLMKFAVRAAALPDDDSNGEFDPYEGDQSYESNAKVIGVCEGCSVGYVLQLLYAKLGKKELSAFLRRRRIPKAAKAAEEILKLAVDI